MPIMGVKRRNSQQRDHDTRLQWRCGLIAEMMPQVSIPKLIQALDRGAVVSFPTDTVPALATRPEHGAALFAIKARDLHKPLILLGASWQQLEAFVEGLVDEQQCWQAMTQDHWPGALTLVLPAAACVPVAMHPTDPRTIGLRVPANAIAQELLQQTGPLATSSANRSGDDPLRSMDAIAAQFPEVAVLSHPDLNPAANIGSGQPSTVIRWQAPHWQLLRAGTVTLPPTTLQN